MQSVLLKWYGAVSKTGYKIVRRALAPWQCIVHALMDIIDSTPTRPIARMSGRGGGGGGN